MEETIKEIVKLKTESYRFEEKNFVIPQELTVTITLSEYRKLVKEVATKDIDISEARSARWEAESKVEELKEENAELNRSLANASKYGPQATASERLQMPPF